MLNATTLQHLTADLVLSVYSGKDGRCCCGCSGKHSYSTKNRVAAGKHRGYTVDDEDINDRMVTRVLKIVKQAEDVDFGDEFVSTVVGERLYVVYLTKNATAVLDAFERDRELDELVAQEEDRVELGQARWAETGSSRR